MLKLMKYEFIHSMRTFMVAFGIFLAVCVIYPIVLNVGVMSSIPLIAVFFGLSGTFLLIGIIVALFVSIFINYHHSMFQNHGYLTLTLPVSVTKMILSKIFVTMIWLVIGGIVLIGGMLLATLVTSFVNGSFSMNDIFSLIYIVSQDIVDIFIHQTWDFVQMVIVVIAILLFTISTIYFSLTVAHTQLVRNHRMLIGVILFFALTFIIEYMMSILFSVISFMNIFGKEMFIRYIIYLIIGILFTCGTIYIVEHHIELE